MHFYESSVITTKDGLYCQVYGNQHPAEGILIKPKYIPTNRIESKEMQYRFIAGQKMNRLDLWADKQALKAYIEDFKKAYPYNVYESEMHDKERLFFIAPHEEVERVYYPREGLAELMSMPKDSLDKHLMTVHDFIEFLLQSGLRQKDFGITYSTLMGHYDHTMSDINTVIYGKKNFWKLMDYMEEAKHPLLKWKTEKEWTEFYKKRNRSNIFEKESFLKHMLNRKKSEGYFNGQLFVIFSAEKEEEAWFRWGEETYRAQGLATIEATVKDDHSSVVRPGCFELEECRRIDSKEKCDVKKAAFYSRDYCQIAVPGEKIRACGLLERVEPKKGEPYERVVTGYFDSYISDRREKEYIKVI